MPPTDSFKTPYPAKRRKIDGEANATLSNYIIHLSRLLETGAFSDIEVLVGPLEKVLKLHKSILRANSGYFSSAFRKEESENKYHKDKLQSKIVLGDVNSRLFEQVVYWLYHREVQPPKGNSKTVRWTVHQYCVLLKAAINFDIPSLKTKAIKECVNELNDPTSRAFYKANGPCTGALISALKILFEGFKSSPDTVEPILKAVCENGFMKEVLADHDLKGILKGNPELVLKLLEYRFT